MGVEDEYIAIPVCDLRSGDVFFDAKAEEWLVAESNALPTWVTFLDQPTGRYEWTADGHEYNAPLHDKHGNVLHLKVKPRSR